MEKTYRTKYFEFTTGWSELSICYHICGHDTSNPMLQIYPFWGKLFLYLPWRHYRKVKKEKTAKEKRFDKIKKISDPKYKPKEKYKKQIYYDEYDSPRYGIYYHMNQLGINWGKKTYLYDTPWAFDWVRTSCLMKDGTWEHETKGNRKEFWDNKKWDDKIFKEEYPYKYVLENGNIQKTTATIRVEEREWRLKYFKWFKYIKSVSKTIDVNFDSPIGEKVNSYKGGVYGTGYEMLKNETPLQTLKRMEKERKFY